MGESIKMDYRHEFVVFFIIPSFFLKGHSSIGNCLSCEFVRNSFVSIFLDSHNSNFKCKSLSIWSAEIRMNSHKITNFMLITSRSKFQLNYGLRIYHQNAYLISFFSWLKNGGTECNADHVHVQCAVQKNSDRITLIDLFVDNYIWAI